VGFASCKAFGRSISASLLKPQTPFPGKGAILLGLPPLDQARMLAVSRTKPLHDAVAQMADDLYGGYAPKQGCFGCLPKVLHDAKPTKQAMFDTPFLYNQEVYRQSAIPSAKAEGIFAFIYGLNPAIIYPLSLFLRQ
jgi:hypothetical protein